MSWHLARLSKPNPCLLWVWNVSVVVLYGAHMAPHIYFLPSFCACFAEPAVHACCTLMLYRYVVHAYCTLMLALCAYMVANYVVPAQCAYEIWHISHSIVMGFKLCAAMNPLLFHFRSSLCDFQLHLGPIFLTLHTNCMFTVYKESQHSTRIATWFYVDRFHRRGHIGCRKCYFVDMYNSMNIKALNSQVSMQANAGLQWIWGQLAYMTPSNYILTLCFGSM